MTGMIKER